MKVKADLMMLGQDGESAQRLGSFCAIVWFALGASGFPVPQRLST